MCSFASLKESDELKKYKSYNKDLQLVINSKNEAIINNSFDSAAKFRKKEKELMDKINKLELDVIKDTNKRVISKEDVALVINKRTRIPVYELLKEKEQIILNIEENLKNNIVGQDEAISKLIDLTKRIKLGFVDENKCNSIIFCGSSGVGKTCLAKIFGSELVGKENIIKLDMSEYSESHSVSKIVGAPPGYVGYSDSKNILEEVRNKPFSVIILDEIEKAHPTIINLLFQILDEGKIKDSKGIEVRFDNTTIIMTSNIGFNENSIGFANDKNSIIEQKLKENFSLPFINRIDTTIFFKSLNKEDITKIVDMNLKKLKSKYKNKGIKVTISKNVVNEIIEKSKYKEFGARKISKIIKELVENQIIEKCMNDVTNVNIVSINNEVSV